MLPRLSTAYASNMSSTKIIKRLNSLRSSSSFVTFCRLLLDNTSHPLPTLSVFLRFNLRHLAMPTIALNPGSTVFLTGVNGLIGSHIADQLLKRGYHVRGAVRNKIKSQWLSTYFDGKYKGTDFNLVEVPDMTVQGCYDEHLDGKQVP